MNQSLHRLLFAVVNAAGFPGIGTVLSGRTRTGWFQIGLSICFMSASVVSLLALTLEMYTRGLDLARLIDIFMLRDTWIFSSREWSLLLFALAGVFAYVTNLLWSLTTTKPLSKGVPPPLPPSKGR